jgi:phage protein U
MEKEITSGAEFLDKKYSDLKKSEQVNVNHENSETEDTDIDELLKSMLIKGGYPELTKEYEKNQEKKHGKIDVWLNNAEEFHERHRDEESMEVIREAFHNEYVIKKEDFPESYFESQKRLAREQGHGDIEITEELREQGMDIVIKDQESTLDTWVDYLLSSDADAYPMWAKYWALRSMTKLSSYDKEKKSFGNRRKDTVAPFPDLNREALAYVVDLITKKANHEKIEVADNNSELQKLLESENFGQFYAYVIEKVTPTEKNELEVVEGEWIKYDRGSDYMPLVESLQGHATGWCTAGESTAKAQLQEGDFYVYYSKDKNGNNTIPRVAIRMQGDRIGEVRGIGPDQNFDPYIGDVLREKLHEFPDQKNYEKKTNDMKYLTEIEKKENEGEDLTKEDLRFLYEIDSRIEGFGYDRDPRIGEIIEKRDIRKDLVEATGFAPEEISLTEEEALRGGIKYHYGHLYIKDIVSAEGISLPQIIGQDLSLNSLKSAEGLELPKVIGGNLNLAFIESSEGLKFPQVIRGSLRINSLLSADGLEFPQVIGDNLFMPSLESAEGLELSRNIGGTLELRSLKLVKDCTFPQEVGDNLRLDSLESLEGIDLPKVIGGDVDFRSLKSAVDLKLPERMGGSLIFRELIDAKGLELPQFLGGGLYMSSLVSAEGLKLPQDIRGDLYLSNLASAEGLEFPKDISGDLYLTSLVSLKGVKLPQSVGGKLSLYSLESAEGVELPETVGGDLDLNKLKSAIGVKLPRSVGGDITMTELESVEGLELPRVIKGFPYIGRDVL